MAEYTCDAFLRSGGFIGHLHSELAFYKFTIFIDSSEMDPVCLALTGTSKKLKERLFGKQRFVREFPVALGHSSFLVRLAMTSMYMHVFSIPLYRLDKPTSYGGLILVLAAMYDGFSCDLRPFKFLAIQKSEKLKSKKKLVYYVFQ